MRPPTKSIAYLKKQNGRRPALALGVIGGVTFHRAVWLPRPITTIWLLIEQQTTNLGVSGSNPFGRAIFRDIPCELHGIHTAIIS